MEAKEQPFRPSINRKSASIERGFKDILADTHRRLQDKQLLEDRLKSKQLSPARPINPTSDIVLHDRFEEDFSKACSTLGI